MNPPVTDAQLELWGSIAIAVFFALCAVLIGAEVRNRRNRK